MKRPQENLTNDNVASTSETNNERRKRVWKKKQTTTNEESVGKKITEPGNELNITNHGENDVSGIKKDMIQMEPGQISTGRLDTKRARSNIDTARFGIR